jgi:hypothetical protein
MVSYHVTLDSQGYLLDLGSYRKRLVANPYAGESPELNAWVQDDWRRGVGYPVAEAGVYNSGLAIDPSNADLRMGPALTTAHTPGASVTDLYQLLVYQGALIAIRGDGGQVYRSTDGTTWTNPFTTLSTGLRSAAVWNGFLHVGFGNSGVIGRWDGTTHTATWITLTGNKVSALEGTFLTTHLMAGANQATGGAVLYKVDNTPTATAVATLLETEISALGVWNGQLWIGTLSESGSDIRGGLYRYDGTTVTRVCTLHDNAIVSFVEFRGELWAGSRTRGKLWAVDEGGVSERWTVPGVYAAGSQSPYANRIHSLLVDDDKLMFPVVQGGAIGVFEGHALGPAIGVPSPAPAGVTTPDPVRTPPRPLGATAAATSGPTSSVPTLGWSLKAYPTGDDEPRGIASFLGKVFYSTKDSGGAHTIRVDAGTYSTATGLFVSSTFDAGNQGLTKLAARVTVYHAPLIANEAISLEYDLEDAGSWTLMGTSDADGSRGKVFTFGAAVVFRRIRFRIGFALTTTTSSPLVQAIVFEYFPRPEPKARWEFECRLEGTAALPLITLDGAADPKTGAQLADALWATAAKKNALVFVDLDGETKTVELLGLEEKVAPMAQRGATTSYSTRALVQLQEV